MSPLIVLTLPFIFLHFTSPLIVLMLPETSPQETSPDTVRIEPIEDPGHATILLQLACNSSTADNIFIIIFFLLVQF